MACDLSPSTLPRLHYCFHHPDHINPHIASSIRDLKKVKTRKSGTHKSYISLLKLQGLASTLTFSTQLKRWILKKTQLPYPLLYLPLFRENLSDHSSSSSFPTFLSSLFSDLSLLLWMWWLLPTLALIYSKQRLSPYPEQEAQESSVPRQLPCRHQYTVIWMFGLPLLLGMHDLQWPLATKQMDATVPSKVL